MQIKIAPRQIQKTILAPAMQQSIELLLLPLTELNMAIEQELQNNPLLETIEEDIEPSIDQIELILKNQFNVRKDNESYQNEDFTEEGTPESSISRPVPLEDYLLEQLHWEISDPIELKIGEFIIGNLDEAGYFQLSSEDVARTLDIKNLLSVEKVLKIIQHFEPLGIAARDIKECLAIQAEYLFNGNGKYIIDLITHHLDLVARKKYQHISKRLKISLEQAKELVRYISSLEPKPARKYRPMPSNIYVKPDVKIEKNAQGEFHILINQHSYPTLRINPTYQKMLKKPNLTQEEREFIREKIKQGLAFIKGVEQRQQTVREIASYILNNQKEFFESEDASLKPMTLKDVAQAIGRNESTICRAVNSKYIETPHGLFPLKFFFSHVVNENGNGNISDRKIKDSILRLIEEENKEKPLSDQEIQKQLASHGLHVARRTISKYRQTLDIFPSHLRKN